MKVIVCLDDDNGMLFNGRRQSRDQKVIEDIEALTESIWISPFSETLFQDVAIHTNVDEKFLEKVGKYEFCFVENRDIFPYIEKIEQLIIYKWNRKYPSDVQMQIPLTEWKLVEKYEFKGNSHENISREIYIRG